MKKTMITAPLFGSLQRFLIVGGLVTGVAQVALAQPTSQPGLDVSANGFPSYTYPIEVPPGIAGVVPKLALSYAGNGSAGGVAGVGWSLQGTSFISRCPTTKAADGIKRDVQYLPLDKLCLDGQRLIQTDANGAVIGGAVTGQTNDALGLTSGYREYRVERDNFSRIRAYGVAGNADNGPAYLKVWTKDGRVLEFGTNPNGNANSLIAASGSSSVIVAWALSRSSDLFGNYADYKYEIRDTVWGSGTAAAGALPGREWNLIEVQYTGNGAQAPANKVVFEYADRADQPVSNPQDRAERYHATLKTISVRLLKTIRTYINSPNPSVLGAAQGAVKVKSIKLTHDSGPVTNRSRLVGIVECAGAAETTCRSPIGFGYSAGGGDAYVAASAFNLSSVAMALGPGQGNPVNVVVADFNGDGKSDLLVYGSPNRLFLSNGDGSFSEAPQFNLGSRVLAQNQSSEDSQPMIPPGGNIAIPSYTCFSSYVTDFNGDGLPDILWVPNQVPSLNCSTERPTVFLNNGDGSFTGVPIPSNGPLLAQSRPYFEVYSCATSVSPGPQQYCYRWLNQLYNFYVFDVNGDGIPDIVTTTMSSAPRLNVVGPAPQDPSLNWSASYTQLDANGKYVPSGNCAAISCSTRVYLGNGDGTFNEVPTNIARLSIYTIPSRGSLGPLDDVTGDGLADIVRTARYQQEGGFIQKTIFYDDVGWISLGDGNFKSTWASGCRTEMLYRGLPYTYVTGDINGDGVTDCMQYVPSQSGTSTASIDAVAIGNGQSAVTFADLKYNLAQQGVSLGSWAPPVSGVYGPATSGSILLDVNGDGRDDIVHWVPGQLNTAYLSNGDGSFRPSNTFALGGVDDSLNSDGKYLNFITGNFTASGAREVLMIRLSPSSGQPINKLFVKADPTLTDQLRTVTSSTGLVSWISYMPLGNPLPGRYARGAGVYPNQSMTPAWNVVSTIETDSGIAGQTVRTEYSYRGLAGNLLGRGMLGFAEVRRQTLGANGDPITTSTQYLQKYPYVGMPSVVNTWAAPLAATSPTMLRSVSNVYCDTTAAAGADALATSSAPCPTTAGVQRPYLLRTTTTSSDLDGTALPTSTTLRAVNWCGEAFTSTVTVNGLAAGVSQTATAVTSASFYADNTAMDNWLICKSSGMTTTNTAPGNFSSITTSAGTAPKASAISGNGGSTQISPAVLAVIMQLLLDD